MVAFKNVLSPTDIAAVVTYERNSWATMSATRSAIASRAAKK